MGSAAIVAGELRFLRAANGVQLVSPSAPLKLKNGPGNPLPVPARVSR